VAGILGIIFSKLRIPTTAAFILAGFLLGPQVLGLITDRYNIDNISQIGFVLLLFVIGLEIDVRAVLTRGRSMAIAGTLTYPIVIAFGFIIAKGAFLVGMFGAFSEFPLGAFYVGIAIAASSSLLVFKLFQEQMQLDTVPGRIAITVLVFEDMWAIIIAALQPSLENPQIAIILSTFGGIFLLIFISWGLSVTVFRATFKWIAKSPDMVLLGALTWCFLIVGIGTNIDTLTEMLPFDFGNLDDDGNPISGVNLHLNVAAGMSAIIAGATIASLPYTTEIVTKVGQVKDFFLTLFFVGLGMIIPSIESFAIPLAALGIAILSLISRVLIFFPVFYFLGIDRRSAAVSSIRLAQMSEFALVLAFIGLYLGHIDETVVSIITIAFVITAIVTKPLFDHAYDIYDRLCPYLDKLGFKEPEKRGDPEGHEGVLMILGLHRDASSLLHEIAERHPDLVEKTTIIDFNVSLHEKVKQLGFEVEYGNITNEEALLHAGIESAKVIICTIPDDILRGMKNVELVRMLRRLNPEATIISNAVEVADYDSLREVGADIVYMSRIEVAKHLCDALTAAINGQAGDFVETQMARHGNPASRREVFR
jgi:Kef-type K+ transport system membrane component KefB